MSCSVQNPKGVEFGLVVLNELQPVFKYDWVLNELSSANVPIKGCLPVFFSYF